MVFVLTTIARIKESVQSHKENLQAASEYCINKNVYNVGSLNHIYDLNTVLISQKPLVTIY